MDGAVVLEGLSALVGVKVSHLPDRTFSQDYPVLTTETFLPTVWSPDTNPLLVLLKASVPALRHLLTQVKANQLRKEIFIDNSEFFDPEYDYDFTNLTDLSTCQRGGESYKRPCGWYRIALKVKGKYGDDIWLGPDGWRSNSAPGEWPVSFHGTTKEGAEGIIQSGYKAGSGDKYGRGIYSTPDIDVAVNEGYAKTFKSKITGKNHMILLQNRINPEYRQICTRKDFWLVPIPEGTSAEREKEIVTSAIRPYGLLLKENESCLVG